MHVHVPLRTKMATLGEKFSGNNGLQSTNHCGCKLIATIKIQSELDGQGTLNN